MVIDLFQSTLPVWGVTGLMFDSEGNLVISIHTPRMGSDTRTRASVLYSLSFQSTLPVWGVTEAACNPRRRAGDFNPHSPYGE